jgi:MoxR-like ATPase
MMANPFAQLRSETAIHLPADAMFDAADHLWRMEEIDALILAWAAQRPLLVRGEAGSGKTQLARAALAALQQQSPKAALFCDIVHPRFEALDLLYRIDTLARLADAELARSGQGAFDSTGNAYLHKGALWRGFDHQNLPDGVAVVLIDEIDKAESDVPNALLGVLGNRSFPHPFSKGQIEKASQLPLIMLTTNEERELPAAFLRRCVVLNQNPPDDRDAEAFIQWLIERGKVQQALSIAEKPRRWAAQQVLADRLAAKANGYGKVGLAEYIDLLTALNTLCAETASEDREALQIHWLKRLNRYALVKGADQAQARPVIAELDTAEEAANDESNGI